jgi:hypothetical protein
MKTLALAAMSLALSGGVAAPGDRAVIHITGAKPQHVLRLYLVSWHDFFVLHPVGTVRPDARGRATLIFRLPRLDADVYLPAVRVGGDLVRGRGRIAVRAAPPTGFTPLGASGCAPASPRSGTDVFGTAVGAQLWALFAFKPQGASLEDNTATYDGVVGKEVKIVFRMTSGMPSVLYSVAPDGARVAPLWGPDSHLGSTWNRPGAEWGAGFVFDAPGCWRIHAALPPAMGDIWVEVRS